MALAKEIDCEKDFPKSREAIYVLVDLISVIDLCMLPNTQGKKVYLQCLENNIYISCITMQIYHWIIILMAFG